MDRGQRSREGVRLHHRPPTDGAEWAPDCPYVIAIVELEEGPRLTANILGCPVEDVRIGMTVGVRFEDVSPEVTLVQFQPRGESPEPAGVTADVGAPEVSEAIAKVPSAPVVPRSVKAQAAKPQTVKPQTVKPQAG